MLTHGCVPCCLHPQALPKLAGSNAQVAILGTGKAKYEAMVKAMGQKNPKFKGVVKFSAPLAHQITAGADFILVPSRCVWVCADTLSSFAAWQAGNAALMSCSRTAALIFCSRLACRRGPCSAEVTGPFEQQVPCHVQT